MNYDTKRSMARYAKAIPKLLKLGWTTVGVWRFKKGGKVYDLSASNLDMLDYIEANELCIVG